ncbi:MAG TPA: hypothetical protein VFW97_15260 [Acidimicrobiia bacterium]|jgi:uncharacterized membrane protein|nr:hypothetical protein [Acidimicrobiia bacterium]
MMDAFETTVLADAATTEAAVREELGGQGFGVVSEIDFARGEIDEEEYRQRRDALRA